MRKRGFDLRMRIAFLAVLVLAVAGIGGVADFARAQQSAEQVVAPEAVDAQSAEQVVVPEAIDAQSAEQVVAPEAVDAQSAEQIAVVITCKGMIDDGLFQSIKRRSQQAIDDGASYLIYEIQTYGGLVKSADEISKYWIMDIGKNVHTVAYITTEAISAGAMISVSCKDIIMLENTKIGDCAPILMGAKLEGVEREKTESFIRGIFSSAAEANGYPEALLHAMVTQNVEVYRVRNIETGKYEFMETEYLSKEEEKKYDLENKKLIVKKDQLLTLTASEAKEYGIARAVVSDLEGALAFLEKRDGVKFAPQPITLETYWSEEMVRWLTSPMVVSVLVMLAMLGFYVEIRTPGLGLPSVVAVAAVLVLVGSKYLIGMANWVEVAIFMTGVILLALEIFVIPGFGVAGVSGIVCIGAGLFGMLIENPPDQVPWPESRQAWDLFVDGLTGFTGGFIGFLFAAFLLAHYLPRSRLFAGLMLTATLQGREMPVSMTAPPVEGADGILNSGPGAIDVGDVGIVVSILRPAGDANFDGKIVDVVSLGEFIDAGKKVVVLEVHGNRVIVKEQQ